MSRELIAAQIKSVLEGVDGMGIVHDYERWTAQWPKFLSLFSTGSLVNGWIITRTATPATRRTLGGKEKAHVFYLRGIYGLNDDDASERTFQALVDNVQDAFLDLENDTLGGTCDTINPDWGPMAGAAGLQVDSVDNRQFGSVLCHYAVCRLCALETLSD